MFKLNKSVGTCMPPFEYVPGNPDESFADGEALSISGGYLTKATTSPEFICVGDHVGDGVATIPVMRINETIEFATEFTADAADIKIGDKVGVSEDGLGVTATTDGCFMVSGMAGTGVGAICTGFFRR